MLDQSGIEVQLLAEIASLKEKMVDQQRQIERLRHSAKKAICYKQVEVTLPTNDGFQQDILDNMAAHVAVLDRQGMIIAVNAAWTRFGRENGIKHAASAGVGANYLEVCRRATGDFDEEAQAALEGIQTVLEGQERYFSLEYPCHSPETRCWFMMYVTPLSHPAGGVIATHVNITERKEAYTALQRQHQRLKYLLQSSDHERQTIAYEIHDGLAQDLAGAIMQLQAYDHLSASRPDLARKAFDTGMRLLTQGHAEARRLIIGVRPPVLDEQGVVEALSLLFQEQNRKERPQIEFKSKVEFGRLVPILENAIYRICQEGLSNACKHSGSERVRIALLQNADWLRIDIRDWGIGFNRKKKDGSYGLIGIRERVRLLGGRCHIQSKMGKGSRIRVELPLMERDA